MSCWELDKYNHLSEIVITLTGIYKNRQESTAVIKLHELTHVNTNGLDFGKPTLFLGFQSNNSGTKFLNLALLWLYLSLSSGQFACF